MSPTRGAWHRWLAEHHAEGRGTWLVYDKGPDRRLSYEDIVEEALCFGWVDSRPGTGQPDPGQALRRAAQADELLVGSK